VRRADLAQYALREDMSEARRWWQSRRTSGGSSEREAATSSGWFGTQRRKVLWAPKTATWCVVGKGVLAAARRAGNGSKGGGDKGRP